jgi:inner membrane protein
LPTLEDTMNLNTEKSPLPRTAALQSRFSTALKMASIALLILFLLIPLAMVRSVLEERLARRDAAVDEITSTWGKEQVVTGPVLIVPYTFDQKSWEEQVIEGRRERVERIQSLRGQAYFLPSELKVDGQIRPEPRHRGIYETVVYSGTLDLSGSFARPSFEEWDVAPARILWDEAEVALAVTDLRGTRESLRITLAGRAAPMRPGSRLAAFENGIHARIQGLGAATDTIPFAMSLGLNGSRGLRFAPVGVNNDVTIRSTWPDPSFQGAFLPAERTVNRDGFSARWQVSYYGRSYPQQWTDRTPVEAAGFAASLFGVDLVPAIDSYRYVERSLKYGILFIALLFAAFFLFEILSSARIHPFQYTLVGIALCLFYLGLLALSEVTSFAAAYWIGAALASLMISLYSGKVLHRARAGALVAAGLALIYAFLFVILRLQDYSLLVGALGLFLLLGVVMFVTRNIDWYERDGR